MPRKIETPTLLDVTLQLLRNRPRTKTLRMIADDTGLSYAWLSVMASEKCAREEPGVLRIQKLYEYLSGKELQY